MRTAIVLSLVVLLLASCAQQPSTPLPTPSPSLDPSAQAPGQTAIPPEVQTLNAMRATLPPTWTPVVIPTATLPPGSATPDATNAWLLANPIAAVCETFAEDVTRSSANAVIGSDVFVAWTAVSGADRYAVRLLDSFQRIILEETVFGLDYTFRADLFRRGVLYAWEVRPIDASGAQMCLPRGALIIPSNA